MDSLAALFDPATRFQRAYADYLRTRLRYLPCPGARRALESAWVEPRGWRAALTQHTRLAITGESGAGKTTALAYIAATTARALTHDPRAHVPLLFSARADSTLPHIYDLPRGLNFNATLTAQAPRTFFASVFASQRALVLIDDADELAPDTLRAALKEYQAAPIIVSAKRALPHFAEYRLPGWHDHQIERVAKQLALPNAAAFVAALKTHNVPRALSANPLTATLLAQLWQMTQTLATRRTALFAAFARALLGDTNGTLTALEDLALAMQRGQAVSNGLLAKSRGLLRATKHRGAEFTHELWQAYFAARALRRANDFTLLCLHLTDPAWRELILFYAGLGDATDVVLNLQSQGAAHLAARAVAHAHTVRADLRAATRQDLKNRAEAGDDDAFALLRELDDPTLVDEWATHLKDPDPGVRARAAAMLGRLQTDCGVDLVLAHLRDANDAVRERVVEALGRAYTDRVIEPLLVALRGDTRLGAAHPRLRIAAARALGEIASDKAAPALVVALQTGAAETRAAAADALKRMNSPLLSEPLQSLAQSTDDELRGYAQEILAVVNGRT